MKTAYLKLPSFLLVLLTLVCIGLSVSGQDLSFLTNGLVAYYPLNGDAKDYSGYGNDGAFVNITLIPDRLGMPNGAVYTTGDGSYVQISSAPQLAQLESTNEITVSFWLWAVGFWGNTCLPLCMYNPPDGWGWELAVGPDGMDLNQWAGLGQWACVVSAPIPTVITSWTHIAMSASRVLQKVSFYANGLCIGTIAAPDFHLSAAEGPLYLGYSPFGAEEYTSEKIDDLRIYARAMSETEVRTLYEYESNLNLTNAPPIIIAQPRGENLYVGDSAELQVVARGNWPLAYQWRKDGGALNGKTNANLTLTSATLSDTGDYTVAVTNAFGSITSAVARVEVATRPSPITLYVSLESTNPVAPFATWETAATNIQQAVDAARPGDTVFVTNGAYSAGDRDGNRVAITNAIRLESVNGADVTKIVGQVSDYTNGGIGIRCVYLGTNSVLSGFTLTNGEGNKGGGAYGGTLYNCTLTGNSAGSKISFGGGAFGSTLYNCLVAGNSASAGMGAAGGGASDCILFNCTVTGNSTFAFDLSRGGGVSDCTLYNCLVTGNSAGGWVGRGGGAYGGTLDHCTVAGNAGGGASDGTVYNSLVIENAGGSDGQFFNCTVVGNNGGVSGTVFNSIVYYNFGENYEEETTLNYCCTTPLPTNGVGNITGPPLFIDMAAGDFRLREESPCIDAGTNLLGMTWTNWAYHPALDDTIMGVGSITDSTDILGNTRFIDGNFDRKVAWDIGAYEFNSFKPPQFTAAPQHTADGWKLNISGASNKWARVQRSSNLLDWEEIWSGFMGEGSQQINDSDTGPKVMFYRVVVP
jgi:hypothetical protein